MKLRLVFPALLAVLAALLVAGCGGGSGESSDSTDPASIAPSNTPLFIELTIRPEGEAKANIEGLAQKIAGVSDVGGLIVSQLEESATEEGEEFDFEKEVEPWLGKRAGYIYPNYEDGDFSGFAFAAQVTDVGAAEDFVQNRIKTAKEEVKNGSYEGVEFEVSEDGDTVGVVEDLIVLAEDEEIFKEVVSASNGESLAEQSSYTDAVANVPSDSAADVYVDIGGLIQESGNEIDSETQLFLDAVGIEPKQATAVASLIPGSDQLEIDLSTDVSGENPPSGDASEMLGSLPKSSVGALASPEFGKRFSEGIDQLDEKGIPGKVPPHALKKALKQEGIDLESIASSIGDVGLFVSGNSKRSLGGALVLDAENDQQAKNTVSNLGLFLRASGTPGVTAISGEAIGFSVRSSELGSQPIVVVAKGSRIAIGYGRVPALAALQENGETLSESPAYKEGVSALGGTPISGFVDGPSALNLASALIPSGDEGFREAKKYLAKIDYLALGSEASGNLTVAKLIVGVGK
ncbi:MAG TPA: DUF3352 domain-containing protein [Solirubrobacterales bacterium]|nr:DUF3352 domain-containing protein [Solirubrobacterales bacterium]